MVAYSEALSGGDIMKTTFVMTPVDLDGLLTMIKKSHPEWTIVHQSPIIVSVFNDRGLLTKRIRVLHP